MSKKAKDKDKVSQPGEGGNVFAPLGVDSESEDADGSRKEGLADDLQTNLPARRVEFPLQGISYEEYRLLMDTIVRYVEPHGYYAIADRNLTLDRVALFAQYRERNFTLRRDGPYHQRVLATLDRCSVPSEALRATRLMLDADSEEYKQQLKLLHQALSVDHLQWNPPNDEEPADFWNDLLEPLKKIPRTETSEKPVNSGKSAKSGTQKKTNTKPVSVKDSARSIAQDVDFDKNLEMYGHVDSANLLSFRASTRIKSNREATKEQEAEESEGDEEDTDDQEQEEDPTPPKGGRTRLRVDNGDEQQGFQRELDLRQYVSRIEKPLGRLLYLLMEAFPGPGIRLPNRTVILLKTLAAQGLIDVRNAKYLVNASLTRDSLATRALCNIALKESYMHVSGSDAYQSIAFKNMVPYWRLPFSKHEGKQSNGYLSNWVRLEWVQRFDNNKAIFEKIIAVCAELLELKEQFACYVESISECFQPSFTLSTQELFELDCDDDVPHQADRSFLKTSSSKDVPGPLPVAPSLSEHERELDMYLYTSTNVYGSLSPPRALGTPVSGTSDYTSLRSAVSKCTASNLPMTAEEMAESSLWLSRFSTGSPCQPARDRKNVNFKMESKLIGEFAVLTSFEWWPVLQFVEHLRLLNSASLNATVTWEMVIGPAIQPDIITRHVQVFGSYCEGVPSGTLGDITCRQMVKVLGRLAESHAFESFRKKALNIFSKPEYVVDRHKSRAEQWQKLQGIIHLLHVIVPVFGRLLGQLGTYLHSQESNFIKLLREIMSESLVAPLFDRIYSPSIERQEQNVIYDMPPNSQQWQWKHVYGLLRMLQADVTVESDLDRQNEERSLMFAAPMATMSRAKLLAVESESDDESSNEYLVPQRSNDRHLSAYSPNRQSPTHAYGKSGSGEGTQKLWNTVRPAYATSEKPSPKQVSFPKATKSICFKDAEEPGTCPFGDDCKYLHADPLKPEDTKLLADHLRAQLRGSTRRSPSASLHTVTEDSSHSEFDDANKED